MAAAKRTESGKLVMKSKSVSITVNDVRSALSAKHDASLAYELTDTHCRGLSLRVGVKSASWYMRGRWDKKPRYWKVGEVREGDDPKAMRRRVEVAKDKLARGIDPKDWLNDQERGGPVERTFDAAKDGWSWKEGVKEYLAHIKANRSEGTLADYSYILTGKYCKPWNDQLLKAITPRDIKTLQDDINDEGHATQAKHVLRVVKAFLRWASQRGRSGIEVSVAKDVAPVQTGKTPKKGRVPTAPEIGKLAWQLDAAPILPAARLAGLLVMFTAQRRESVMSARVEEFEEDPEYGLVWHIGHVKMMRAPGELGHVVPLPPGAAAVARAALASVGSGPGWLFPQTRLRRSGDSGGGHMASQTPEKAMEKTGSVINPHDMRRAFAVVVENLLGFARIETKLILDHTSPEKAPTLILDDAEGQSNDVTARHYALHAQLRLKNPIIVAWNEWLLRQIAAHRPEGVSSPLPAALAGLSVPG